MFRVGPLMNNHTMQCIATELSEVEIKEKRTHNDLINARTPAALQEYQDTPENIPVQQQFSRIKCSGHGKAPSRCKIYELCLSRKRYKRRLLSACHNSNFAQNSGSKSPSQSPLPIKLGTRLCLMWLDCSTATTATTAATSARTTTTTTTTASTAPEAEHLWGRSQFGTIC